MLTKFHRLLAATSIVALLSVAAPAARAAGGTIVLVHGAFADGSSWSKVIPLLEAHGLKVIAVQLPMTSLADDVAATNRAIDRSDGPVTLVGHSWGGTVVTQAGVSNKIKALVYVAAFANQVGTNDQDLVRDYPAAPGGAEIVADQAGFAHLSEAGIVKHFAPDLPPAEQKLIAATQGPIRAGNFGEKTTAAAWSTKPSWYIVAENDHMIPPAAEQAMAKAIKAHTTTVKSSHVVMLAHPDAVAKVIEAAATQ